jgi:hypothetical protein
MKQIQPVTIWANGVNSQANYLGLTIINDNLSTSATFYYQLFNCTEVDGNQTCNQLSEGNLVISGTEYDTWGDSGDINTDAYTICAGKLGLTLV